MSQLRPWKSGALRPTESMNNFHDSLTLLSQLCALDLPPLSIVTCSSYRIDFVSEGTFNLLAFFPPCAALQCFPRHGFPRDSRCFIVCCWPLTEPHSTLFTAHCNSDADRKEIIYWRGAGVGTSSVGSKQMLRLLDFFFSPSRRGVWPAASPPVLLVNFCTAERFD